MCNEYTCLKSDNSCKSEWRVSLNLMIDNLQYPKFLDGMIIMLIMQYLIEFGEINPSFKRQRRDTPVQSEVSILLLQ